MEKFTFSDYKQRISIMQVAIELGYKFDKRDGRTQPAFVLHDRNGKEVDKIYIKNPQNNSIQGYWRRSLSGKDSKGDLISFVKENLSYFPEASGARNEIDAINKVLARMAGVSMQPEYIMQNFINKYRAEVKPFNIDDYERSIDLGAAMKFLTERGINRNTAEIFAAHGALEMIKIKDPNKNFHYKNLAFPYRIPGKEKIVGYEVRGWKGYKGKAEGSDSTNASWYVYLGDPEKKNIKELHFAESALDIMAYYQIKKDVLDVNKCVFVSTGGSFSENQIKKLFEYFPEATPVLHFDNDLNGYIYDCKTSALRNNLEIKAKSDGKLIQFQIGERFFSVSLDKLSFNEFKEKCGFKNDIMIEKAPGKYKDWNEVIQPSKNENTEKLTKTEQMENNNSLKR